VPLVNDFEGTFDGDKAKLFWPTSLDGKKVESETYKIIAVSKVNSAATPTKPTEPAKPIQPSEVRAAVQKAAEVSLVAVPSQAETVTEATVTAEGTASVTSEPDGADMFIDSVGRGRTPALLKLKPGKHSVQVVHSGYRDWISEVDVKTGSIVNITATLQK
jgi:PEGA domain